MKKILLGFVMACVAITCCACGGSNSDTVKVGFVGNLSGDYKFYGEQVKMGADLAVKEINAKGGVLGKNVELVVKDDAGDPVQAATVYQQIKGKVCAIVGPVLSGASESVAGLANNDKIAMITPSGSAESLTKNRDYVFRACLTDPSQGKYLYNFASEQKYKKVYVLKNEGSTYSSGIVDTFVKETTKTGADVEVCGTGVYNDDNIVKNLQALVTNIVNAKPDAILCPDYVAVNQMIVKEVRKQNTTIPFLGADGWDGVVDDVADADKALFNNCYFTNNLFSGDTDEKIQNFYKAFKAEYPDITISAFAALAYDSVYMVKDAIKAAGSTDKTAIRDNLAKINFTGATGKITFDADGNPSREVPIIVLENGVPKLVKKITE